MVANTHWRMRMEQEFFEGDQEAFLEELDTQIRREPENLEAHDVRAACRVIRHDFQGAIDDLTVMMMLAPTPDLHQRRAEAYLELDRFAEALQDLNAGLEVTDDPAPWPMLVLRTRALIGLEEPHGAEQDVIALQQILNTADLGNDKPILEDQIVGLQVVLYGRLFNDMDRALQAFEQLPAFNSDRLLELAEVQIWHGLLAEATKSYTQIIYHEEITEPNYWYAHLERGKTYVERDIMEPALQDFSRFITHLEQGGLRDWHERVAALGDAHVRRAQTHWRTENASEAVTDLRKALVYTPHNDEAAALLKEYAVELELTKPPDRLWMLMVAWAAGIGLFLAAIVLGPDTVLGHSVGALVRLLLVPTIAVQGLSLLGVWALRRWGLYTFGGAAIAALYFQYHADVATILLILQIGVLSYIFRELSPWLVHFKGPDEEETPLVAATVVV